MLENTYLVSAYKKDGLYPLIARLPYTGVYAVAMERISNYSFYYKVKDTYKSCIFSVDLTVYNDATTATVTQYNLDNTEDVYIKYRVTDEYLELYAVPQKNGKSALLTIMCEGSNLNMQYFNLKDVEISESDLKDAKVLTRIKEEFFLSNDTFEYTLKNNGVYFISEYSNYGEAAKVYYLIKGIESSYMFPIVEQDNSSTVTLSNNVLTFTTSADRSIRIHRL